MHRNRSHVLIAVLICLAPSSLWAINGAIFYGVGPRNRAMAGANCAAPVDSSTIMINPAGLSHLSTSADLGADVVYINGFVDTSHATGTIVNTKAGLQRPATRQRFYTTPFMGGIYNLRCSNWSYGMLCSGVASGGGTFQKPIVKPDLLLLPDPAYTAAQTKAIYDTGGSTYVLQTSFGAAYKLREQLSFGASLNTNVLLFSGDNAISTPLGLMQTEGRGRLDTSYGVGFTLGTLYDFNEQWAIGLTFVSPQWFEKSYLYGDLISKFRLPPQVRIGLAYRPNEALLLTADWKWLGWHQVEPWRSTPINGGLGWDDQHTIALGMQYEISSWVFRAGYNYGKTPIRSDVGFANALIPCLQEHHVCLGCEFQLAQGSFIAVSAVYEFRNTIKDNGKGDLVSQLGKGTRISNQSANMDIAWTLKF
jgi:long-chain fatty acid transport protein